jgi:starvation-inducible outer membrane lipoprotein
MNLENSLDDGVSQSVQTPTTPVESSPSLYSQLKAEPSIYIGRMVTLSGIVLKAKRLQGSTEVEILQLPEAADGRPMEDRRRSEGRFLALQTTTFLDPAILATGPMVTVVGSVEETVERPLEPGSDPYTYPVIAVQQLTVWPSELLHPTAPFYPVTAGAASLGPTSTNPNFALDLIGSVLTGIFQGLFNSSGSRHRSYSSSSYSSSHSSGRSSSNPSPPPPKDIPPQFRKPN